MAGLTVALSLIQAGLRNLEVLEAMPDSAATQGGGTLVVTKGTVTGLQGLGISPSEYLSPLTKPPVGDVHDWQRVGVTSWHEMYHALRARLPDGILRSGMRLKSHIPVGNGRSLLGFTDGTRGESELTIYADGRNSRGRRLIGDHRELQYSEFSVLRGQAMPPTPDLVDLTTTSTTKSAQFVCSPLTKRTHALPPGQAAPLDWSFCVNLSARKFQEITGSHPTVKTFVPPHEVSSETSRFIFDQAEILPPNLKSIVYNSHLLQISPTLDLAPPATMTFKDPDGAPSLLIGDAWVPQRPQVAQGMNLAVSESIWLGHLMGGQLRGELSEVEVFQRMDAIFVPLVREFQERGVVSCQRIGLGVPAKVVIPGAQATVSARMGNSLSGLFRAPRQQSARGANQSKRIR